MILGADHTAEHHSLPICNLYADPDTLSWRAWSRNL